MRAVIYCRVSTKEQIQNLSLPTQRRACEEYCRREDMEVARVFMEAGESAKTANRTELNSLLAYCRLNKRQVNFVVVYNLSRFSRDTRAHHALTGLLAGFGISLRSVMEPIDDSPTGRLLESFLSSLAQFDNDVKAQRTRVGMTAALQLGRWTFQAPVGFLTGARGGPSLIPDPERADLVRKAFEEFGSGRLAKRDVLNRLNSQGLRTRRGRPLSPQTFNSLLRNPVYAGRIVVGKFDVATAGDFEPLVSELLFRRVQARLAGRGLASSRHSRLNPDFPLRRFVRCDSCETPLTGSWSRGHAKRYAYYHCAKCGEVRMAKGALEAAFEELLSRLQPRVEFMDLFEAVVLDVWKQRQASNRSARSKLEQQRGVLQERMDKLDEAFLFTEAIDRASYERQRDKLREQLALNDVEADEAATEDLDVEGLLAFGRSILTDASRLWAGAAFDQKLRLQSVFFPEGLSFDGVKFGTAPTCLAFAPLPASSTAKDALASPTRFELVLPP